MKRNLYFPVLILALLVTPALAQDITAPKPISPEKRKLISEIIVVTKMDKQVEQMSDIMLASAGMIQAAAVKDMLDKHPEWTQKERDAFEAATTGKSQVFFAKFRERLPAAIKFDEYIEKAVYPIYDRTFTEKELIDLLAFYRSDTGQKVLVSMPDLMKETMEVGRAILLPQVFKLVDEIIAEETAGLKPAVKRN